jgi:hypothetical protein
MRPTFFATVLVAALASPAFAGEDELRLMLLKELSASGGLGMKGGQLPINLSTLAMDITTDAPYVKPANPNTFLRVTKLALETPAGVTEAEYAEAGFGGFFNDDHVGATMGHRTPADRAAYLKAFTVAWRTVFALNGDAVSRRGFMHPEFGKLKGDIYPHQLDGMLGIRASAPRAAGAFVPRGAPPRTPRAPKR